MTKLVKPHPNLHPPSLNSDSSNGPVTFPSSNSDSNSNSNHSSDEHERDRSSEKEHKRPLGLFKTVKRAGSNLRLRSISTFTRSHRRTSSTGDSSRSYSHSSHSLESSESSDRESSNPTHPQLVLHPFPAHPDPPTSTKDLEPRHRHISLPSFSRFRLSRAGSSSSARGGSSSLANTISTTDPKGHSGLVPIPSRVNLPSPTTSLEMERDSGNSIRGTYHSHPPSRSPSMISSDSESVGLSLATPEIVVDSLPTPPSPPGLVLSLSRPNESSSGAGAGA
ncbi:hypothetical protein BT96DRAFT_181054 [Gymnopus androsaceus JB14]|uniref:Uncharacterized protein n=1 Tax=Gymnopus androsaceus JB14 TaxID=1447944 RepID=A0A6A4H9M2_9AGAR|nr:hypothetical protein BT96DRAFT_181054 [Gymnopus androsaceus JB14]